MTHDGEPELIHQTQALSHSGLLLGDAAGRFSTEEARTGHAQPRAEEKPEICPLLGDLLFLSDACILRPNQIQRANQGFYIRSRAAAVPLSLCLLTCSSSSFTKLLKTAEHLQREVQTAFSSSSVLSRAPYYGGDNYQSISCTPWTDRLDTSQDSYPAE